LGARPFATCGSDWAERRGLKVPALAWPNFVLVSAQALSQTDGLMKIPSGTLIVTVSALIATVSLIILQACATGPSGFVGGKYSLKIGEDPDNFVEFKSDPAQGKERFDAVLRRLPREQYSIRYKQDANAAVDPDYHPPRISLKTTKVNTSRLANEEPVGDPHVTQHLYSNNLQDIKDVVNSLK
jgi:hypothetical protein